ncbi:type II secretion system protein F [Abditibacteriota bacterium]|nr:type II secretion system protein F [Abditibacteriota bacterium]
MPLGNNGAPPAIREQFVPRANAEHLSVYFHQMRALLNAGVGLIVALDEMARNGPNGALRNASLTMKQQLNQGRRWSEAMRAYPALFPPMVTSLIAAGEESGNLVGICGQLSEFADQEYQMQQLYTRETWYPKVLLFFSTVVIPLPISIVFFGTPFSLGFREQALFFGGIWAAWYGASWIWPVTSRGKPRLVMDRWKLQLPIVKDIARGFAVAKVWRVLGTLYGAGVSLPAALRIAANGCGNTAFAQSLLTVAPRLEQGETLSSTLTATGEFPAGALTLLQAGEQSGDLDKTLAHSVRFLEMDAKTKLFQATKTIAYVLYLLVAFKIAVQVIQFWTGTSLHIGG